LQLVPLNSVSPHLSAGGAAVLSVVFGRLVTTFPILANLFIVVGMGCKCGSARLTFC